MYVHVPLCVCVCVCVCLSVCSSVCHSRSLPILSCQWQCFPMTVLVCICDRPAENVLGIWFYARFLSHSVWLGSVSLVLVFCFTSFLFCILWYAHLSLAMSFDLHIILLTSPLVCTSFYLYVLWSAYHSMSMSFSFYIIPSTCPSISISIGVTSLSMGRLNGLRSLFVIVY